MNRSDGRAGRIFLCLIGLMLILAGGAFEWLMIRSYEHAKASREWPQAKALVLRSEIDERQFKGSPREFRLNVLFGYTYQGEEHTSDKLSPRGAKWTKETESLELLAEKYGTGTTHTAWVNPDAPDAAILVHDTKAAGYTLWFPGIIIVGGGGMIWGALRK